MAVTAICGPVISRSAKFSPEKKSGGGSAASKNSPLVKGAGDWKKRKSVPSWNFVTCVRETSARN